MPHNQRSRSSRRDRRALDEVFIPEKLYFRIGEVSKLTQTKSYVLRYWESEFPTLRPGKSSTGHRLYKRHDVETVLEIRRLLYAQGFTIEGARKKLGDESSNGKAKQKHLFAGPAAGAGVNPSSLRSIRHELQGIAALLSRKPGER